MSRLPFIYARMDVNYADHPKIVGLSDAAFRAHVELILYARKHLTDGRIGKRIAKRFGNDVLTELLTNDPETPSLSLDQDGDYTLHGFVSMQGTKADVELKRQVNAVNGRRGGLAKGGKLPSETLSDSLTETLSQSESESESEKKLVTIRRATAEPSAKRTATDRAARLPDDWQPNPRLIEFVRSECPAVNGRTETEQFRDYWHSKAGKDATKTDWDATYRKWMRTAQQRAPGRAGGSGSRLSTTDQRVMDHLDLSRKLAAREAAEAARLEITP